MANKTFKYSSAAFVILALGALGACSPKAEKKITITDPNTGEKTDLSVSKELFSKDKEINITNQKDGASIKISQGEMPASMPSYVELYPGASELTSMQASGKEVEKEGKMTMVSFKSKDDPKKIIDFYTSKLTAHGYKSAASMNLGGTQMATLANENDKQALQIMITQEPTKDSMVQLIYGGEH